MTQRVQVQRGYREAQGGVQWRCRDVCVRRCRVCRAGVCCVCRGVAWQACGRGACGRAARGRTKRTQHEWHEAIAVAELVGAERGGGREAWGVLVWRTTRRLLRHAALALRGGRSGHRGERSAAADEDGRVLGGAGLLPNGDEETERGGEGESHEVRRRVALRECGEHRRHQPDAQLLTGVLADEEAPGGRRGGWGGVRSVA